MAEHTSSSITIEAAPADVMSVIADFARYPEWTGEVKEAEVLATDDQGRAEQVRLVLDAGAIKDDHVLKYTWLGDKEVSWTLVKSQMLRSLDGTYALASMAAWGAHRGHLQARRRRQDPAPRHDQAQGREGHHRPRARLPEEARRVHAAGLRAMRTVLVTGPGGAGRTTLAAASALAAAASGRRTLLVSAEPIPGFPPTRNPPRSPTASTTPGSTPAPTSAPNSPSSSSAHRASWTWSGPGAWTARS